MTEKAVALQDAIEWYLTTVRSGVIKQMQAKGFWVTGKTGNNIKIILKKRSGSLDFPKYFSTMVEGEGRRPGSYPPIQEIMGWIASRNLELNPYAVAKKMAEKGNAVYRGAREGVDVSEEVKAHQKEFKRRVAEVYKGMIKNKIKQLKK